MEEKITPSPKNGFQLISKYRGALMGIASIWVFVFHAWISVFPEPQTQFLQTMADIELFVRKLGYTGVDTFLHSPYLSFVYIREDIDLCNTSFDGFPDNDRSKVSCGSCA